MPRQTGSISKYIALNGLGSLYVCGITLFKFVGTCEKGKLPPFSSMASERRQPKGFEECLTARGQLGKGRGCLLEDAVREQ